MPKSDHDTNLPILILVRRGRRGKGFLVCAADDIDNPAPCADEAEVGEVIAEMLNDPEQARADLGADAEAPHAHPQSRAEMEEYEGSEEEGEGEREGEEDNEFVNGLDPMERLVFAGGKALLDKGRELSNSYRKPGKRRGRTRRH